MKIGTVFSFDTAFEYWAPFEQSAGGNVSYRKIRDDNALLMPVSGGLAYLVAEEPMRVGSYVEKVRDPFGNAVFTVDGSEYRMWVVAVDPQFNAFGRLTAYKHSIRRELGRSITPHATPF